MPISVKAYRKRQEPEHLSKEHIERKALFEKLRLGPKKEKKEGGENADIGEEGQEG